MHARLTFALLLATACLLAQTPGCSNYGEGQQCSAQNGNDDCESGLICTLASSLNNGGSDICCPPIGATNPACIPGALAGSSSSSSSSATGSGVGGEGGTGGLGGGGGQGGGLGGGTTTSSAGGSSAGGGSGKGGGTSGGGGQGGGGAGGGKHK